MAGTFELKRTADEQFLFNLKAGNSEIILTGERYKQKASAMNGIESVRKNSQDDARFERLTSSAGQPYFVLKATNGEPLGRSEMYSSASSMENGIKSVMKNAPDAAIKDLTA